MVVRIDEKGKLSNFTLGRCESKWPVAIYNGMVDSNEVN